MTLSSRSRSRNDSAPTVRPRWSPRVGVLVVVVAPLLAGMLLSSHGALGRDDTSVEPLSSIVPDESLDPRILSLELGGTRWHSALTELDASLFEHQALERGLERSRRELIEVRVDLRLVTADHRDAERVSNDLDTDIAEARAVLEAGAIARFVRSGETESDIIASVEKPTEGARRLQLSAEASDLQMKRWRNLTNRAEQMSSELSELGGRKLELQTRERALVSHISSARATLPGAQDRIANAIDAVRDGRRHADIPDTDIPVTALDAYLNAEVLLAESAPECGIEWWMIAGVGRIESRHGELGGRHLDANGLSSTKITGIALDGGPDVRAIVDTDGGRLDGDSVWDRAVGPMQFIPETWSNHGRDGNGDRTADPHNIYDAAYSSGRHLCYLGGDLTSATGLERAYFGYNTSDAYVADVRGHAEHYREVLDGRLR